jgi:hypothetical protein
MTSRTRPTLLAGIRFTRTCPECGRLIADTGTVWHQGRRRFVTLAPHKRAPRAGANPCPSGPVAL